MTKHRIVGGTITKNTGGEHHMYTNGVFEVNAGGFINLTAKEHIYTTEPKKAPETKVKPKEAVKEIELLTPLDLGSDNDGKGGFTNMGMLLGNVYHFRVKSYEDTTPTNKKSIKWKVKFHNLTKNEWQEIAITATGENLKLTLNDEEMCGRYVYVRAYINDDKKEGELKVWMHNRFRWFDRNQIKKEIEERKHKPWLANQKNTSLCGMAAVMYLLAKQNYTLYKRFILELHRKGYYKFDEYVVDVSIKSKHLLEMNPKVNKYYPEDYEGKMPYCDWISFSSIRDQENNVRNFDGEDDFSFDGSTLPNEIKKLMKVILGYSDVIDNTNTVFNKGTLPWDGEDSSAREIAKMSELREKGYSVIMLVNTNMIKQDEVIFYKAGKKYKIIEEPAKKSGFFDTLEHWIVFEGIIGDTINWDEYDFKVFTWGEIKKIIINPDIFSSNYYGYVYGK